MQYEVEKVVEEDETESKVKVRWKGYSAHDDTWEPISAINSAFVDAFRQSQMIETRQGMQRRHVHDKPGHIYSYQGVDVLNTAQPSRTNRKSVKRMTACELKTTGLVAKKVSSE